MSFSVKPNSQNINNLIVASTKRNAVIIGNSIGAYGDTSDATFASGGVGASYDRGYVNVANWRAGSPLIIRSNIAVSGVTSTTIITNQLSVAIASGYKFILCVESVSNDVYNSINHDTSVANLKTIITACKNAGVTLFLGMTLPRSSEGGTALFGRAFIWDSIIDWNLNNNMGAIIYNPANSVIDNSSFVNSYNNTPNLTYFLNEAGSYIHLNAAGGGEAAGFIGQQGCLTDILYKMFYAQTSLMSTSNGDGSNNQANSNLVNNSFLSGTGGSYGAGVSGAAGLPTNWYAQRYSGTIVGVSSIISMATAYNETQSQLFNKQSAVRVNKITVSGSTADSDYVGVVAFTGTIPASDGWYYAKMLVGYDVTGSSLKKLDTIITNSAVFTNHVRTALPANAGDYKNYTGKGAFVIATRPFFTNASTAGNMAMLCNFGVVSGGSGTLYVSEPVIQKLQ
jgi:hypothetical protein